MVSSEIAVKELIDDCLMVKCPLAENYGIELEANIEDPGASLRGDRGLLRAALSNLIDAAIKHAGPGGKITIGYHADQTRESITVTHNGGGIPYDELCDMHDLFCRSSRSFDDDAAAMDARLLGLSIVRDVADLHGGRVGVRSREGEGSTFSFHLPRRCTQPA